MPIKLSNVMSKADWVKLTVLLVFSVICWIWVYHEYQKPLLPIPPNNDIEVTSQY